jgi:hypothetical protein
LTSIYRALVRNGLIQPRPRRRPKADYRRWERAWPMELWQLDVMGGIWLTDGRELKAVTGIDDHSRSVSPPGSSSGPMPAASAGSSPAPWTATAPRKSYDRQRQDNPQTPTAVAAPGRAGGAALAAHPPSSQPSTSESTGSGDRADGDGSTGRQRTEPTDRPSNGRRNAGKDNEGRQASPARTSRARTSTARARTSNWTLAHCSQPSATQLVYG